MCLFFRKQVQQFKYFLLQDYLITFPDLQVSKLSLKNTDYPVKPRTPDYYHPLNHHYCLIKIIISLNFQNPSRDGWKWASVCDRIRRYLWIWWYCFLPKLRPAKCQSGSLVWYKINQLDLDTVRLATPFFLTVFKKIATLLLLTKKSCKTPKSYYHRAT